MPKSEKPVGNEAKRFGQDQVLVEKGSYYVYVILFLSVLTTFGMAVLALGIDQVVIHFKWVLLGAFLVGAGVSWHIYRRTKRRIREILSTLQDNDRSQRTQEISVMSGMLKIRVEPNPKRQIESPSSEDSESGEPTLLPRPDRAK